MSITVQALPGISRLSRISGFMGIQESPESQNSQESQDSVESPPSPESPDSPKSIFPGISWRWQSQARKISRFPRISGVLRICEIPAIPKISGFASIERSSVAWEGVVRAGGNIMMCNFCSMWQNLPTIAFHPSGPQLCCCKWNCTYATA